MPTAYPARRRLGISLLTALLVVAVSASATGAAADPSPVSTPRGGAVWPLRPVPDVVLAFDPPSSPWGAGHRGVDLRGTVGQAVHATLPGRITFAGKLAGRGVVVVAHGSTRTTYEPVHSSVSVGDYVPAGTVIGVLELGRSHCFPAACLHWGLKAGDAYLDPLTLLGAGPVRLLPLAADATRVVSTLSQYPAPRDPDRASPRQAWHGTAAGAPGPASTPPSAAGSAALFREAGLR